MKSQKRLFYPSDLAEHVRGRLKEMHVRAPALFAINEMIEVAFFASMKAEESERVLCNLAYLDIKNPDPSPPERIVADRWSYIRFAEPIPLDVKNLVKVSKSIDGAYGALAVSKDPNGKIVIWGAIDQQGQRAAFLTQEADEGAESPGLLQVDISGVGSIEVYKDYTFLGALRQGTLAVGFSDVLEQPGPIHDIFQVAIAELVSRVQAEVGEEVFQERDHWPDSISGYWIQAFSRVLLGVQRYGHGGAILLTPDNRNVGFSVKYPIRYARLGDAIRRLSVHTIKRCNSEDEIFETTIRLITGILLWRRPEVVPTILSPDAERMPVCRGSRWIHRRSEK